MDGIAGENRGKIENCTNNVKVTTNGSNCGGIVALNNGIIYKCKNTAIIHSNGETGGGIAGMNGYMGIGYIIECINTKDVFAGYWCAGGIAGANGHNYGRGYICNSYNTATVTRRKWTSWWNNCSNWAKKCYWLFV